MLEDKRVGDDKHQDDGQLSGLKQRLLGIRMPKHRNDTMERTELPGAVLAERASVAVHKVGNNKGIDCCDRRRFCRCKNVAVDAAKNNYN